MENWWVPTGGRHSKMTREQFRRFCVDVLEFGEDFDPTAVPIHAEGLARDNASRLSLDGQIAIEVMTFHNAPWPPRASYSITSQIGGSYRVTLAKRGHDATIVVESRDFCEAVCRAVATRYGFRLQWGKR